jgi:hypothetical protein
VEQKPTGWILNPRNSKIIGTTCRKTIADAEPIKEESIMSNQLIVSKNLNNWLAEGKTGTSSLTIASHLTGINFIEPDRRWPPSDPSDIGRCLHLLEMVPEFKDRFPEMKEVSAIWSALVDNWQELEQLYWQEYPSGKAPQLYNRIKEIENATKFSVGELII